MGIFDTIKKAILGQDESTQPSERSQAHQQTPHEHDAPSDEHSHEGYISALLQQRQEKDHFFKNNAYYSPLPQQDLYEFDGLSYYEPNPTYQYTLELKAAEPEPLVFETSTGTEQEYERIGTIDFEVEGEPATLAIYKSAEGDFFLPFRDATSGKETYGAGRYLEPVQLANKQLLLDFNLAYNPYCAYSTDYTCPLPPFENWLQVPIRAGEKVYK